MVTIYDLLEVDEKASKEEIEKSYQRLILEYHKDPKLTEKENADNEIILNKIKIAYDILFDDEKRAKYDKELAKKRAEELIKNVSVNREEVTTQEISKQETSNQKIQITEHETYGQANDNSQKYTATQYSNQNVELSEEEKQQLKKAAQEEFENNLKIAQKAEEEYNKAYNEAYNNYMKKLGYKTKEPLTIKRIMNVIIFIIVTILVCGVIWLIPPTRNLLIELYNENIIIKSLVDIVKIIFNAIISIFK